LPLWKRPIFWGGLSAAAFVILQWIFW